MHRQIADLCEEHPIVPKVLLVDRIQRGEAILQAVARQSGGWIGLEAKTPILLAKSLVKERLQGEEEPLPEGLGPVLAGEALRRLSVEHKEALGEGSHALSVPLARTFDELRLQGITAESYQDFCQGEALRQEAKAKAYVEYQNLLEEEGYLDAASIFRRATEKARDDGWKERAVVAVPGTLQLPALPHKLLSTLREEIESQDDTAFFLVGRAGKVEGGPEVPPTAAANLFEGARLEGARFKDARALGEGSDRPQPISDRWRERPEPQVTFQTAVGAEREVESIFADILRSDTAYDEVEIAYADPDPYRTVVETVAERHDLPVTISVGRPVGETSVGQSLRGFFEWITGGLEAETLVRLLRGGLLRLDRLEEQDELKPARAATLLAEQRYSPGPEGYFDALRRKQKRKEDKLSGSESPASESYGLKREIREIEELRSAIGKLMKLVPKGSVPVAKMAENAASFLEVFGPVDQPPEDLPKEDRSPAQAARGRIIGALQELTEASALRDFPRQQAIKQIQRLLDEIYARASAPKPGYVHVVPLVAAGYAGRRHLYAVGLDGESTSATVAEDPLLTDREQRQLEAQTGHPFRLARTAGDRRSWLINQGLGRHQGPLVLSTRTFDVTAAEDVAPAPLYLQLREEWLSLRAGETPDVMEDLSDRHVTLLADPETPLLGGAHAWRAAETIRRRTAEAAGGGAAGDRDSLEAGGLSRTGDFPAIEGGVDEAFPWIRDGRQAERARRSGSYTAHDGLLGGEEHPGLDVLDTEYGQPLSASRLEMLAASPYAYFLKYVLGARPLEEPALDDVLWIDRRRQGSILHETFRGFMETMREQEEPPSLEHEPELIEELEGQIEAVREQIEPPSNAVAEAMKRRLAEDARVFLKSEVRTEGTPLDFEVGFGFGSSPHRDSELEAAEIDLTGDVAFQLRGQIDRVDRSESGNLVLWDYKTGSKSPYEGEDAPLQKGEMLQWALYAYAVEDLTGSSVEASGYFFTSTKELGDRISHDPDQHREEIAQLLRRLSAISRSGCFPMNPDSTPWMFGDYDRIVPDLGEREEELGQKTYPEGRPVPPHLEE